MPACLTRAKWLPYFPNMNDKTMYIYHISDSRNLPVIIHPFDERQQLSSLDEKQQIEGRYGIDPEVEAMAMVRNLLYTQIDREVREWMAERRFFPRFLLAVGVFFVSFFFTAFVIRDPIPLLDELLVASAAAVASYFIVERKGQVSKPALEKKILLKKRVDKISFSPSDAVSSLEQLFMNIDASLRGTEQSSTRQSADELQDKLKELIKNDEFRTELSQLSACIDVPARRKKRIIQSLQSGALDLGKMSREELLYAVTESQLRGIRLGDFARIP